MLPADTYTVVFNHSHSIRGNVDISIPISHECGVFSKSIGSHQTYLSLGQMLGPKSACHNSVVNQESLSSNYQHKNPESFKINYHRTIMCNIKAHSLCKYSCHIVNVAANSFNQRLNYIPFFHFKHFGSGLVLQSLPVMEKAIHTNIDTFQMCKLFEKFLQGRSLLHL